MSAHALSTPGGWSGRHVLGLLCLAAGCVGAAPTPAWPTFGGPARTGVTAETGLLPTWPEAGPVLLWTAAGCGKGYSSVAVADGRLFTAGQAAGQTLVVCRDLQGRVLWRAPSGPSWQAPPDMPWAKAYDGARATPTVSGDTVYHLGELGVLSAFAVANGALRWSVDLRERFGAPLPKYGFTESVLVRDDRLFCCPGGPRAAMVALDARTGATVWTSPGLGPGAGYASMIPVAAPGGGTHLLTMSEAGAFAVRADTGALLWQVPLTNKRRINAVTPLVAADAGSVFLATGYGAGCLRVELALQDGTVTPHETWRSADLDNQHGGVVLLAGHLYGSGHESPGWFCLDFATGRTLWRERSVEAGSLTAADGRLYLLGEKGTVALVEPSPERFLLRGRFSLPKTDNGPAWAHPVVCGGRLYIRHGDLLYAYDIAGPVPAVTDR